MMSLSSPLRLNTSFVSTYLQLRILGGPPEHKLIIPSTIIFPSCILGCIIRPFIIVLLEFELREIFLSFTPNIKYSKTNTL